MSTAILNSEEQIEVITIPGEEIPQFVRLPGFDTDDTSTNSTTLIVSAAVASILFTLIALFVLYRKRAAKAKRYNFKLNKTKVHGLNLSSNWSSRKQTDKAAIPIRNLDNKLNDVIKRPNVTFIPGVPTVILSNRSPSLDGQDPFENVLVKGFDATRDQEKIISAWFLDNEEFLSKQDKHKMKPGHVFRVLFADSKKSFEQSPESGLLMDRYAIETVISKAIQSNIFDTLGSSQQACQRLAAYLKGVKALNLPRSTISLLDWEVFTYAKEFLNKQGFSSFEQSKKMEVTNPILEAVLAAKSEIYQSLKIVLPLTFINKEAGDVENGEEFDPTQNRMEMFLFGEVLKFFLVKSFDPTLNFFLPVKGEKLNSETMNLVEVEDEEGDLSVNSVVDGAILGGLKGNEERVVVKSLVF